MKIQRQKLIDVLTAVKPGLAKKAIIDQATHFIMTGQEILTYNDRICISYPFKTDFSCSIIAEEFYKILMRITHNEVDIELKDGQLAISAQRVRAHMATESGDNVLPMIESLKLERAKLLAKPLPEDFIEGVTLCMFSAAKDMGTPILTCLYLNGDMIASTDDMRISEFKMSKSMGCSILLPAASAMELVKFNVKQFAIAPKKTWVYFFTEDGAVFCSRLVSGQFPDYAKFMTGFDSDKIDLPDDMPGLVETASILAEGDNDQDRQVEVAIDKGRIKCKGQNKIGWVESDARIRTKLEAKFTINSVFFLKILEHTKSMYFDGQKALFKSGGFRHIIALKGE